MATRLRQSLSLSHKRGTVLVVALWSLVILSTISMAITGIVSPQIKLSKAVEERFASQAAAEAALKYAYFERIGEKAPKGTPEYDSLPELATERNLRFGKVLLTYKLVDEESKVDINTASKETMMRFPGLNNDSAIADNIIAYRINKSLTAKEELLLIEGVTPEAYAQFKDFITVWTAGAVNINTVSEGALRILGFSDSFINALNNFRNSEEGIFKEDGQIRGDLEKIITAFSGQDDFAFNDNRFTVKSRKFQMIAETKFQNQSLRKYRATFDIEVGKVLRWEED